MAFIKLFPPEGGKAFSVDDILRRLRDECAVVDADPDEGRDQVAGMIVATLRFSDSLPHKQAQLARLQAMQAEPYLECGFNNESETDGHQHRHLEIRTRRNGGPRTTRRT